ncbi:hypothetical protein ACFL5F_04655 [Planctomycetota bacterium]
MKEKNKTILNYFILILLAAAIIASGRYINSKKSSPPEKDDAAKLAELRADLTNAAKAGSKKQHTSGNTKRTSTRKTTKAGST